MNEQLLEDLLDRSVDGVPNSPAPLAELLREGSRLRRRHRRRMVGALAAGGLVVGAVTLAPGLTDHSTSPEVTATVPEPPAGMKWVGVGNTVVAVPPSWPVVPGIYCGGPKRAYVTIVEEGVVASCLPGPGGGISAPALTLFASGSSVRAHLAGMDPVAQTVLDSSRTRLPSGWLAVPAGGPAGGVGPPSLTDELDALKAAGFRVVVRTADPLDQWRAVTTDPEIGTPARIGSTVVVYDRGTVASSAELHGRLTWVGGPAPGNSEPHAGTVHVVSADDSFDQTVATDARGRWVIDVPPGRYTVTATSPGYLSAAGEPDACRADGPVNVRADRTARADVYCQMM